MTTASYAQQLQAAVSGLSIGYHIPDLGDETEDFQPVAVLVKKLGLTGGGTLQHIHSFGRAQSLALFESKHGFGLSKLVRADPPLGSLQFIAMEPMPFSETPYKVPIHRKVILAVAGGNLVNDKGKLDGNTWIHGRPVTSETYFPPDAMFFFRQK